MPFLIFKYRNKSQLASKNKQHMMSMEFELQRLQSEVFKQSQQLGLIQNYNLQLCENPVDNLSMMINALLSQIKKLTTFKDLVQKNQINILNTYDIFIEITQATTQFSKIVYSDIYQFPLQTFQCFRKSYELLQDLSNSLNSYQSNNQIFLGRKDQMISQQIRLYEEIKYIERDSQIEEPVRIRRKNSTKTDDLSYHQNQMDIIENQRYVERLNRQIQHLNHLLRKNDHQFSLEINKYNEALHQMGEQIRAYQKQYSKQKQLQAIIQDLQTKIVRLKEQKYRNQIIVDNMAKKIRIYEKQKNGNLTFLSPNNRSNVNRNFGSPDAKTILNSKSFISNTSLRNQNAYSGVYMSPIKKY